MNKTITTPSLFRRLQGVFSIAKTIKPAAPTYKPATATPKPAAKTTKPAAPTYKPATATPKPATKTTKPAAPTYKPATATPKPAAKTTKPAAPTYKPATPTSKPAAKTTKPSAATSKPATAAVVPLHRRTAILKNVKRFKTSSESEQFRSSGATYAATVRRLVNVKEFSLIEEILEHQKNYPEITTENFVIRLISLYGKSGMLDHARKLFDEMPELKCERTVKSFNALLSACVDAQKFDKAYTLLKELVDKLGIQPNVVSYNTVIKAYIKMSSLDSAMSVFEELEKNGLNPDVITFNTLMEGFYRKGQFTEGEKIWTLMKSRDIEPDIRSYNSKLRGLTAESKTEEGILLVDEMKSLGIKPDVYTYNALIKCFMNAQDVDEVKRLFNELENECVPDRYSFMTMVEFLIEKGDLNTAVELCKIAIKRRVLTNSKMVQSVLDRLMKESRGKEAMEIVNLGKSNRYFHYKLNLPKVK